MILLIAVWIFFMRQMQGGAGGSGIMSIGKSRARQFEANAVGLTVRFWFPSNMMSDDRALDAAIRAQRNLRLERHALGVVAPPAARRAALQEDGRANPGPVVHAEPLHVEDESGGRGKTHEASMW